MNVTQKTPEACVRWSPGAWGLKGEICWRNAHDFLLLPFVIFLEGLGMAPRALPRQSRHSLTRLYPGSQKTCWIWRLKESAVKNVCCFCQIPVEFVYAFFFVFFLPHSLILGELLPVLCSGVTPSSCLGNHTALGARTWASSTCAGWATSLGDAP